MRVAITGGTGFIGRHLAAALAAEIVRGSGLQYTVLKEGITYGKGDHMLDHLSRTIRIMPLFASVGLRERFPWIPLVSVAQVRMLAEGITSRYRLATR
jgi:hypothetical protein